MTISIIRDLVCLHCVYIVCIVNITPVSVCGVALNEIVCLTDTCFNYIFLSVILSKLFVCIIVLCTSSTRNAHTITVLMYNIVSLCVFSHNLFYICKIM